MFNGLVSIGPIHAIVTMISALVMANIYFMSFGIEDLKYFKLSFVRVKFKSFLESVKVYGLFDAYSRDFGTWGRMNIIAILFSFLSASVYYIVHTSGSSLADLNYIHLMLGSFGVVLYVLLSYKRFNILYIVRVVLLDMSYAVAQILPGILMAKLVVALGAGWLTNTLFTGYMIFSVILNYFITYNIMKYYKVVLDKFKINKR